MRRLRRLRRLRRAAQLKLGRSKVQVRSDVLRFLPSTWGLFCPCDSVNECDPLRAGWIGWFGTELVWKLQRERERRMCDRILMTLVNCRAVTRTAIVWAIADIFKFDWDRRTVCQYEQKIRLVSHHAFVAAIASLSFAIAACPITRSLARFPSTTHMHTHTHICTISIASRERTQPLPCLRHTPCSLARLLHAILYVLFPAAGLSVAVEERAEACVLFQPNRLL